MTNSCGSCKHFLKLRDKSYGLCNLLDRRAYSDSAGKKCNYYKRIKFYADIAQ